MLKDNDKLPLTQEFAPLVEVSTKKSMTLASSKTVKFLPSTF